MRATIYKLGLHDAPWRYALAAAYNADMVEAIKSEIPSRQRKWCPDVRQWWFTAEAIESVLSLANHYYDSVRHADGSAFQESREGGEEGSHTTLAPVVAPLPHLVFSTVRAARIGQSGLPRSLQDSPSRRRGHDDRHATA